MKKILLCLTLLFFMCCCAGGWLAWRYRVPFKMWDAMFPIPAGDAVTVRLNAGQKISSFAKSLVDSGVVRGTAGEFGRWLARLGVDRRLRPGAYKLVPSDAWTVARQLRLAEPDVVMITIVPGADIYSFCDAFDGLTSGDTNPSLLSDRNFPARLRPYLPKSAEGRMAFLLPETYSLSSNSPDELVSAASDAWMREFGAELASPPVSSDKNAASLTAAEAKRLKELAIVASLVEREALWDDERAKIAGVIYNRLERRMLLQIDASVVYAHRVKGRKLTRVLFRDLEIKSPYNTYIKAGLPPEPICAPSELSWRAAFAPEEHKLLYYVADKDGRHIFSYTNAEHNRNVRKVRGK